MRYLAAASAATIVMSAAGTVHGQQSSAALGEESLQPMQITCGQIMDASEAERQALVFFIAGYAEGTRSPEIGRAAEPGRTGTVGAAGSTERPTAESPATPPETATADRPAGEPGTSEAGAADRPKSGTAAATTPTRDAAGMTDAARSTAGAGIETGGVPLPRTFFTMSVDQILEACEGNPEMMAHAAISQAQPEGQGGAGEGRR